MSYWKKFLNDYFFHSKKARLAVLCILIFFLLVYISPYLFKDHNKPTAIIPDNSLLAAVDTLQNRGPQQQEDEEDGIQTAYNPTNYNPGFLRAELFEFDPNTLSLEGWQKLGLNQRTVKTINNYRNKGGKFYKPEDLQKIWGLPKPFYERVKNYISITSLKKTYTEDFNEKPAFEKKKREVYRIDINEGDTTAFIALPGIGSKLALRIVNFRDKLGGFYSTDQISETYGLADSTFQKIKPYLLLSSQPKLLNLNTASKDELKTHPYIKWNLANAIVEYRNQHGAFKSIEDLKNIVLIDEAIYNKIIHYLTL